MLSHSHIETDRVPLRPPICRFRRGFSLVELFVVVVIIGTLSVIAVPRFGNVLATERLASVSRRLITELAYAQRVAKTGGKSQSVSVVAASRELSLTGLMDPDHPLSAYVVSLGEEPYSVTSMVGDFAGLTVVQFDAYGVPTAGGTITVAVGEYQTVITVDPDTGLASVGATTIIPSVAGTQPIVNPK